MEAYGDKDAALALAGGDPEATRRYIEINYGPWDRLRGDGPFVDGVVGDKPAGANFYPADMTVEEFEAAAAGNEALRSLYTLVRRGDGRHRSSREPYHEVFAEAHIGRGGQAAGSGRAGQRPWARDVPPCARRRPRVRRLPAERHGVARHEGEPDRCRDRTDRDLRGPDVWRQGHPRGIRPDQGHGMERAAGALRGASPLPAAEPSRSPTSTRPRRRGRTPT